MKKQNERRTIAARILLWVFVPMLLLSSVHVHRPAVSTVTECYACVHHIRHDAHLTNINTQWKTCVLCQFISLPFVGGESITVSRVYSAFHLVLAFVQPIPPAAFCGLQSARAPPFTKILF